MTAAARWIRAIKLYGVHRATAARWLADARACLGDAIRSELAARLRIAASEVDSIVRLVQSRVDMSLDRLLVTDASRWRTPCRGHQRAPSAGAHRASSHGAPDESL